MVDTGECCEGNRQAVIGVTVLYHVGAIMKGVHVQSGHFGVRVDGIQDHCLLPSQQPRPR